MRVLTALGSAIACVLIAPSSFAVSVTALEAFRSGTISVSNGLDAPNQSGFVLQGAANQFLPYFFDDCVNDDLRSACLSVNSSFFGLGSGMATTGFFVNGDLSASKPTTGTASAST